jgi:hypothetical protein
MPSGICIGHSTPHYDRSAGFGVSHSLPDGPPNPLLTCTAAVALWANEPTLTGKAHTGLAFDRRWHAALAGSLSSVQQQWDRHASEPPSHAERGRPAWPLSGRARARPCPALPRALGTARVRAAPACACAAAGAGRTLVDEPAEQLAHGPVRHAKHAARPPRRAPEWLLTIEPGPRSLSESQPHTPINAHHTKTCTGTCTRRHQSSRCRCRCRSHTHNHTRPAARICHALPWHSIQPAKAATFASESGWCAARVGSRFCHQPELRRAYGWLVAARLRHALAHFSAAVCRGPDAEQAAVGQRFAARQHGLDPSLAHPHALRPNRAAQSWPCCLIRRGSQSLARCTFRGSLARINCAPGQ